MSRFGLVTVGAVVPIAIASALLTAPAAHAEATYTLTDVRAHSTAADCWSVVESSVYNLTAWIDRHPGGAAVIKAMCGINGTAAYNSQHLGGREEPGDDGNEVSAVLARYRIGAFQPTAPSTTTYTMAQVAAHGTAADCWSVVGSAVYDLTAWVGQHPGGPAVIKAMCGTNGTAMYASRHQGSTSARGALDSLQIGTIGTTTTTTPPTATKTYTMRQVRRHRTAANCWSAINGGVYNLTAFVSKHPGGSSTIAGLCGRRGSVAFNAQHKGSASAKAVLKGYKIGRLR